MSFQKCAVVASQFVDDLAVPVRVNDDALCLKFFAAARIMVVPDVDLLDCLIEGIPLRRPSARTDRDSPHHINGLDVVFFELLHMALIIRNSKQGTMNLRMESLDPSIENLRNPVSSDTERERIPLLVSRLCVPPVETISTFIDSRACAKSTRPVCQRH